MKTLTLIPETGELDALVSRVVDADTVDVCLFVPLRVRLVGIQAAESNTVKGKLAAKTLADRVTQQVVTLRLEGKDKYGRALAKMRTADGRDMADWLIGLGLAVPWDGRGIRPAGQNAPGEDVVI